MNQHYISNKEINKDEGIGSSDPTPTLPEGEGVKFDKNELFTANESDSIPTGESRGGIKSPVNSSNDTSGQKTGYNTANPYTYPYIKDYRKDLKEQDEIRTNRLNKLGYEVIRFTNDEVLKSPYQVAHKIKAYLNNRHD